MDFLPWRIFRNRWGCGCIERDGGLNMERDSSFIRKPHPALFFTNAPITGIFVLCGDVERGTADPLDCLSADAKAGGDLANALSTTGSP